MRPFEAPDLPARLGLFLAPLPLAVVLMATGLVGTTLTAVLAAGALAAGTLALVLLAPWNRLPVAAQVAPPLLTLTVLAMLIAGEDGAGASPLVLLVVGPVVWMAVYHEPAQVWAGVAGAGVAVAVGGALAGLQTGTAVATASLMVAACAAMSLTIFRLLAVERETRRVAVAGRDEHRLVLDHLPDTVIIAVDRDLRVLSAEGGGVRFDPEDIVGRSFDALLPAGHELGEVYTAALAGRVGRLEFRDERDERVYDVEVLPLRRDGVIVGALSVARDVTQARAAAARLAASERDHRLLTESASDMISRHDLDGVFLYVSAACRALLGRQPRELIGRPMRDLVAPADHDVVERACARTRAVGSAASELRMVHREGGVVWVEQSLRRVGEEVHATVRDVTARRETERRLEHLATHDDLTALWNRRRFNEALREELARAQRREPDTVMLLLDLDGFKEVNDSHGHPCGDRLLIAVAEVIRSRMREGDGAARLGGDEFAVLLRGTAPDQAEEVARVYGEAIEEATVATGDGGTVSARASVGWAVLSAEALDERSVLAGADAAMYQQKALRRQAS